MKYGCYAAKAKDEALRMKSSSGGLFSLFALAILRRGGVVFGAAWNVERQRVEHRAIMDEEELEVLRGSKYVRSSLADSFDRCKEFLASGREVLFCGTPCQIAALKKFVGGNQQKLSTIDIVCAGAPPAEVLKAFVDSERKGRAVFDVRFRDKSLGWHCKTLAYRFDSGWEESVAQVAYYGAWNDGITLAASCFDCKFNNFRSGSDVLIGDAWGADVFAPEMRDEKGLSVVFLNTANGVRMWDEIAPFIQCRPIDPEKAIARNRPICRTKEMTASLLAKRELFWQKVRAGGNIYSLCREYVRPTFVQRMHKILGRIKRSVLGG